MTKVSYIQHSLFSIALISTYYYDSIMDDIPSQWAERAQYQMGSIDSTVENRALAAVKVLSGLNTVRAAYLFGSHAEGTPDQWSDIDIGVFMEGIEHWDIHQRATAMVLVMEQVGSDVEAHLFPVSALDHPLRGGFAEYIQQHGTRIFKRGPAVIGRNVTMCHPKDSLDKVERVIELLKSGERDHVDFWIDLPDEDKPRKLLIRYFAIRDENEKYLGILETTINLTPLQVITGENRLGDLE